MCGLVGEGGVCVAFVSCRVVSCVLCCGVLCCAVSSCVGVGACVGAQGAFVSMCGVARVCGGVGVWWAVCGAAWPAKKNVLIQNPSVCTFRTSPCVPANGPHIEHMRAWLPVHTETS